MARQEKTGRISGERKNSEKKRGGDIPGDAKNAGRTEVEKRIKSTCRTYMSLSYKS